MNSAIVVLSLLASASSQAIFAPSVPTVTLGGCQDSAVQAGTAITFGGALTTINSGNIGVSPGNSITGNYKLKSGSAHNNDAYAKQCASDMKTAYSQASSQTCTKLIASDLGSLTLTSGVYCTPSGKFIVSAGTVTLDGQGNPYAEWIFQTDTTLVTAGATSFKLINNARAGNVYWAIGSSVTLGGASSLVGNILAQVSITFGSGSNIIGRGLAQAAVTFASGSTTDEGQQSIGLPAVYVPASSRSMMQSRSAGTPPSTVSLGGCQNSAIQAQTTITFDGKVTTIRSGDIGVSPGTSITGNYKLQSGSAHSNDAYAQQCTTDMKIAYSHASSQTCTHQIGSDLSGLTLISGVYCTPSGKFILSSGSLTLDALGNPYAEWVFQTDDTLITSPATSVVLRNNAQASNVYWAIGTSATVGDNSSMVGNILAQVSITFGSGSDIVGRGLAQAAVTFASGTGSSQETNSQSIGLPSVYVSASSSVFSNLRGQPAF
jgi:hypothetical protein